MDNYLRVPKRNLKIVKHQAIKDINKVYKFVKANRTQIKTAAHYVTIGLAIYRLDAMTLLTAL